VHGPSWTHVGPPSNATYDVSGSLRDVATTIAARTEAGSVTATPSSDTETWTPDGGDETIIAARVTVAQVEELPNWTDRDKATKNQQAEWDRFKAAITTHEAGHVSTDKASFAAAHSSMVGQKPGDGDKKLDAVAAKAKTDNETYDTTTKHGLTQGTGINPNIDEVTKVP
jgi:predicted secreted Zn-dependent protease